MTRSPAGPGPPRIRLAEIERELARLRHRHDTAMSAFLFEEAAALGNMIGALDRDREALAAGLPAPPSEPAATGAVPALARPRRQPRRRR